MATIRYQKVSYENVKLPVMSDLCADIVLSHDYFGLHEKVEMAFSRERGTLLLCGLDAAEVQSPPQFAHLQPDCKPIVTKSRKHPDEDERFIRSDI